MFNNFGILSNRLYFKNNYQKKKKLFQKKFYFLNDIKRKKFYLSLVLLYLLIK